MKRLLLLSFLCLVPSAHAVDYVKCEAMVRAYNTVMTLPDLNDEDFALRNNRCEELFGAEVAGQPEWMDCYHSDETTLIVDKAKKRKREKQAMKAEKIRIDMSDENCPQVD